MPAIDPTPASAARGQPPAFVPVLDEDDFDDIELGFECANPALQIERWADGDAGASFD